MYSVQCTCVYMYTVHVYTCIYMYLVLLGAVGCSFCSCTAFSTGAGFTAASQPRFNILCVGACTTCVIYMYMYMHRHVVYNMSTL